MVQGPYSPPPAAPLSSPVQPPPPVVVAPPPPRRPAWPTPIGIISICLASLSLACDGMNLVFQLLVMAVFQTVSTAGTQPGVQMSEAATGPLMLAGADLVAAVVLLVGGILLLKRRPVARAIHLIYAMSKMLILLIGVTLLVVAIREASAAAATTMPTTGPAPGSTAGMKAFFLMGGGFGVISKALGLLYPIFLLVWFLRAPVVNEVRTWALSARAAQREWGADDTEP